MIIDRICPVGMAASEEKALFKVIWKRNVAYSFLNQKLNKV